MLDEYMKTEPDGKIRYMGSDEIHILIPKTYEALQLLTVTETVRTLGIFEIWKNPLREEHKEFFLPGVIEMQPSDIVFTTIGGDEFVHCTFRKGDVFLMSNKVVKNEFIAYALFSMYLEKGKIPPIITYDKETWMFDIVAAITGSKVSKFNHAIFEMIYSHLCRCANDVHTQYRYAENPDTPYVRLKLSDLPNVTTSLTAKLESGYLAASINAALTHENENESKIEELLRQ